MSAAARTPHRAAPPREPRRALPATSPHGSPLHPGRELLLVLVGLLTYFGVRAATSDSEALAVDHARAVHHLERTLGLAHEAALQDAVVDHHVVVTLANWVYIWGHWPAIAIAALWLFRRHPDAYRRTRTAFFVSGAIGMLIFLSYPVAPPRLAGFGLVDTVTLHSHAYRALQPPALTDRYAALPSLHFGWDLLIGIALARSATSQLVRSLGRLMPVLMGLAVVLTANHYLLDVLVGGLVALTGLAVAVWLERRARGDAVEALDAPAAVPATR